MKRNNTGFTLVELVMVIALLSIIATLAVNRLSGVRADAEKKLDLANLGRIGSAIDAYAILHPDGLDRLDAPFCCTAPASRPAEGTADTAFSAIVATNRNGTNAVLLASTLLDSAAPYPPLFARYSLTRADADALRLLGLRHVMLGTDGTADLVGDDGAWARGDPSDPDLCSTFARTVTNGLLVAAVNPRAAAVRRAPTASDDGLSPVGAIAYQSCGQDVRFSKATATHAIDGIDCANDDDAFAALRRPGGGGLLLAFGLGQHATPVGDNRAGLDSAPVCPVARAGEYRRYFLLLRLRTEPDGSLLAEYAGTMDSRGQTTLHLRSSAK